jgi:hypothetical protein
VSLNLPGREPLIQSLARTSHEEPGNPTPSSVERDGDWDAERCLVAGDRDAVYSLEKARDGEELIWGSE